jgi:hypothetical protein
MPITPLHWSVAYISKTITRGLSLPALVVSTAVPDLETPFVYASTGGQIDRLVLHSILGAASLATLLAVILTVVAYPPVISKLFKMDQKIVKQKCRLSLSLIAVCLFGNLSHVIIDSLHHNYNPLLFPFTYNSFDALVLMNNWVWASVIVQLSFLVLLLSFVAWELKRGTKNIWNRLLVG